MDIRETYSDATWADVAARVSRELQLTITSDMARNRYGRVDAVRKSVIPDEGDTIEGLKGALHEARTEIANQRANREELGEAFYRAITTAIMGMDIPPVLEPEFIPFDTREQVIMLGSDWQMGKLVRGHYSSAIAIQRVADWVDDSIRLIRDHGNVDAVHLLLLGDLLENETVFPTQASRIDASLYTQVFDVAETIVNAVRRLLAAVPMLYVEGVGGNHGYNQRNSHPETNFDCMAMNTARLMLKDEPRLIFPEPRVEGESNWYMLHEVGDLTVFGFHGHQLRTQPNQNAARAKMIGYYATMGPFDIAVSGHYHTSIRQDLGAFEHFGAGSTESGNSYAQEWLATGKQAGSQWTLFTDGLGITSSHLIRLA